MLTAARARIGQYRYRRGDGRRRRLERARQLEFYASVFQRGDLVFDVGANVGDRTDVFVELGARVIAYEPLAELAEGLRNRFSGVSTVTVREVALASAVGTAKLSVGDESTISSMSQEWQEAVVESGRFADHTWSAPTKVPTSTLDAEMNRFGMPAFCKVDVEGFEFPVLQGMSSPIPALSLEYTHEYAEATVCCLRRLTQVSRYEVAFSPGESMSLWPLGWLSVDDALIALRQLSGDLPWGDVYARLRGGND